MKQFLLRLAVKCRSIRRDYLRFCPDSINCKAKAVVGKIRDNSLADYIGMVVIVLMATGTVFVFSASANVTQELSLQRFYDFPALRKILFFPVSVLVMYVASRFDYRRFAITAGWFKSPAALLLAFSTTLLVLVLIPGIENP